MGYDDDNELFDMILSRDGCSGGLTLRVVKEHISVDDARDKTPEELKAEEAAEAKKKADIEAFSKEETARWEARLAACEAATALFHQKLAGIELP